MHADSFHFLPKALQFAFQDYKSIWSAKADSGLLARGLSNVEKWPQDLGKSAIENYGSISLGHLNQSLLHPKYLDIFIFFFCLLVCFGGFLGFSNESDNQHCLLMTWLGLRTIQVNAYVPFTCTDTAYFLVTFYSACPLDFSQFSSQVGIQRKDTENWA